MRALEAALEAVVGQEDAGDEPVEADAVVVAETALEHIFVLEAAGGPYEVQILGPAADLLGIDHEALIRTARIAAAVGAGPDVVTWLPEHRCLVTRATGPVVAEDVSTDATLAGVAGALGALHAVPTGAASGDSVLELAERHRRSAMDHAATVPPEASIAAAVINRIEQALGARTPRALHLATCHRRLVPAAVSRNGKGVHLTGFAFAGSDDRVFDLASFAAAHSLDDAAGVTLLGFSMGGKASPADLAAFRLLRVAADYVEAMRELVLDVAGDTDAAARAQDHLNRCLVAATDARFEDWLLQVAADSDDGDTAA